MIPSKSLQISTALLGWQLVDEFGTDLQIETHATKDGKGIVLRIVDYLGREFPQDERKHADALIKAWNKDHPEFKVSVETDRFEFEVQMTISFLVTTHQEI